MSGTHGDLFSEIGKIVLAAHSGSPIDLKAKSEDLANRYWNLGLPPATMAKALARSIGAIGVSMALVAPQNGGTNGHAAATANGHENGHPATNGNGHAVANGSQMDLLVPKDDGEPIKLNGVGDEAEHTNGHAAEHTNGHEVESPAKLAAALFPSGVRLAVLS